MESQHCGNIPYEAMGHPRSTRNSEHDTVTTDRAIRREFRKYYVWLYSPKSAQRVPQLGATDSPC
eukprot:scaffold239190_cov32-Tisochrysis_lutea.AAC.1